MDPSTNVQIEFFASNSLNRQRRPSRNAREQLQQKLWPADTFVDFDVGLTAIRKIRQVLGDDADRPHFYRDLGEARLQVSRTSEHHHEPAGVPH